MAHTTGHVAPEEHLLGIVDRVDLVHQDEEPLAFGKHDELRPPRSGLAPRGGVLVVVGRLDRDEILASDDLGPDRLHSVAELGALDHALPMTAAVRDQGVGFPGRVGLIGVPKIAADAVPVGGVNLIGIGLVATRLHQPIDDHQPVADLAESSGLVEKRSLFDAGHPVLGVLLGDDGFELVGLDLDGPVVLGHARPRRLTRRLGPRRHGAGNRDD